MNPRRYPRHLIADVLDEQVVDADGNNAGRIDGIVLIVRDNEPPRVVSVEISPITLLARVSRRLAAWYARFDRRLGSGRGTPARVAWEDLEQHERNYRLSQSTDLTPINALERWLARLVERIPGA